MRTRRGLVLVWVSVGSWALGASMPCGAGEAPPAAPKSGTPDAKAKGDGKEGERIAWRFNSHKHQVALLELFTSQECNSCPPVDKFVSNLGRDGYGFEKVVPLAYHVSYWPHLGWTDKFSKPECADRQKQRVAFNQLDGPYTPQLVLNGRDCRDRGDGVHKKIDEINLRPRPIKLALLIEMSSDRKAMEVYGQADRSTTPVAEIEPALVRLAVFEMGQSMKIGGGENKGKTLLSDFVVRHMPNEHRMDPKDHILETFSRIEIDPSWKVDRLGIAAFVENKNDGKIIQATGGLLDPKTAKPAD